MISSRNNIIASQVSSKRDIITPNKKHRLLGNFPVLSNLFPAFSSKNLTFQIRNRYWDTVLVGITPPGNSFVYYILLQPSEVAGSSSSQSWFYYPISNHLSVYDPSTTRIYSMDAWNQNITSGSGDPVLTDYSTYSLSQGWVYTGTQIYSSEGFCLAPRVTDPRTATLTTCSNAYDQIWDIVFSQGLPSNRLYSIQNRFNSKCVGVNSTWNLVSGQQLQLRECNGEIQQLWMRPSSDLRIQTAKGKCMDTLGSPRSDGSVVLFNCNDSDSQKWLFDGVYLRPKYNISLCLSITSGNEILMLELCSKSSIYMNWTTYLYTSMPTALYHIGGYAGTMDLFRCPPNQRVISVSGTNGVIIKLNFNCSDGTFITMGGTGGSQSRIVGPCTGGFTAIAFNSINYLIGDIDFYCSNEAVWKGFILGSSGQITNTFVCPQGQVITGFNVWSGEYVNGIDAVCDSIPTVIPIDFRIEVGPIRSLLGKCITIPLGNYSIGQILAINDCTGGPNQQWVRPNSMDLRLQTQNNSMCMDVSDDVGPGSFVVISLCSVIAGSQQWIFDGSYIRPKSHTWLCLSFQDDNSLGGWLILSPCEQDRNNIWGPYSISEWSGSALGADTYNHFICPAGSKVISINSLVGTEGILQLEMICDDRDITILGHIDGLGDGSFTSYNCSNGYNMLNVTYGAYIGNILTVCRGLSPTTAIIGMATGLGCCLTQSFTLKSNQRIIGMQTRIGSHLNAIAFLYGTVYLPPTTYPTLIPSLSPSSMPSYRFKPSTKPKLKASPTSHPSSSRATMQPSSYNKITYSPQNRSSLRPTILPTIWSKPWVTYTSPIYGELTSKFQEGHRSCPKGSKVTYISKITGLWVNRLSARCDDKNNTVLGPWGSDLPIKETSQNCPTGFDGWNITYGSYIGRLSFACDDAHPSVGSQFSSVSSTVAGTTTVTNLATNQKIVGFRVYYDITPTATGIIGVRIEYANFPRVGLCKNALLEPTGKCPTKYEWLAILWGFLTMFSIIGLIGLIVGYIVRKRHKKDFAEFDVILPLR